MNPPKTLLREANDMETVNDMRSAWGAVQVQPPPDLGAANNKL
ncbi:hypothetical protein NECAME_11070 [Necator americanus]|nr:hypothetical protein NECAME_11070 [Necator americanus]ETN77401.1 hypothetical protein NECAME_11070 [Necator americanus]